MAEETPAGPALAGQVYKLDFEMPTNFESHVVHQQDTLTLNYRQSVDHIRCGTALENMQVTIPNRHYFCKLNTQVQL